MSIERWHEVDFAKVYADAERVVTKGATPGFSRAEYQDAMMRLAHDVARGTESVAVAFSKLMDEQDSRLELLFAAAERADVKIAIEKRQAPSNETREKALNLLNESARIYKRADETQEQAMARLLNEDPAFQAAYEAYVEAQ